MAVNFVDHIGVLVFRSPVFREMSVIGGQFRMLMGNLGRIVSRPAPERHNYPDGCQASQCKKSIFHPKACTDLPGDGIGHQPAYMA